MASVIRGRSFAPSETVTADALNQLVRNATLDGLTLADFAGENIQWASTHTAPTDAGAGWLTAEFEQADIPYVSGPTTCELTYFLRLFASGTSHANVGLFHPYRIESRRFSPPGPGSFRLGGTYGAWYNMAIDNGGKFRWQADSLTSGAQQGRRTIGGLMQTAASTSSSPDFGNNRARFFLWGMGPGYMTYQLNYDASTWLNVREMAAHGDLYWPRGNYVAGTHVTQSAFYHGWYMRNDYARLADRVQPIFLFAGFALGVT